MANLAGSGANISLAFSFSHLLWNPLTENGVKSRTCPKFSGFNDPAHVLFSLFSP